MIRTAKMYSGLGFRPIPILPGTKRAAVPWMAFQTRFPTDGEIEAMFSRPCNIALCTGMGSVVIDVDDPALLDEVIANCGDTPMKSRTPAGGFHLWFSTAPDEAFGGAIRIHGKPLDMRGERHYSVEAWSRCAQGVPYEWLGPVIPTRELPPLRAEWLGENSPPRSVQPIAVPSADLAATIRRATAYLACIEGAIAGHGGHDKTFRVCCVLARKFELPEKYAWPILLRWNEECEPPWTIAELQHKMRDAYQTKDFESGVSPSYRTRPGFVALPLFLQGGGSWPTT